MKLLGRESAIPFAVTTLAITPITVIAIVISRALPLEFIAIAPGIIGGLLSLLVLLIPWTRGSEYYYATFTAGILGWLVGVLLYSVFVSEAPNVLPLIVVTAVQPAIFTIVHIAASYFSSRGKAPEGPPFPETAQQVQGAVQEPAPGEVRPAAGTGGVEAKEGTRAAEFVAQQEQKEVGPQADVSQEGKRRIAEVIGFRQPALILSLQERAIVEMMAEVEGALVPVKDIASETGGRYLAIEKALLYDPATIYDAVNSLLRKGVLENAGFVFKSVCCPKCLKADAFADLVCPQCRSDDIVRQDIYQCGNCGYLGPQQSFTRGAYFECPQCKIRTDKVLSLVSEGTPAAAERGTGQQSVLTIYSSMFRCGACGAIFDVPRTRFHCKSCGEFYDIQSGLIFRYTAIRLKPAYRDAVLREKRPIIALTNLLRSSGLITEAPYVSVDEMGVTRMADLVVKAYGRVVAAVFSVGAPYKSTADVISEAFWFKVHEKVDHVYVLSVSKLAPELLELARNLEIEVIDLADVSEVMLRGRLSVIVDRIKGSLV
ncbi:MAG: hypothetical protein QXP81_02165 [Nitrososphaerota archaeon]